jgi:hypothetical protein
MKMAVKIRVWIFVITMAALCALSGCGGGFGADGDGAQELGPGIFGPDSARR